MTAPDSATLLALASRLDAFCRRSRSTIEAANMSVESQAIALGMLVTTFLPAIEDATDVLRARAGSGDAGVAG